jgi:hypothetical protein
MDDLRPGAERGPALPRRRIAGGLIAVPAWLAGGAAALGAAGCASPGAVPAPPGAEPLPVPALRRGDRWRYRLIDRYNGGIVGERAVEVVATEPELRLRIDAGDGAPPLEERWSRPWVASVDAGFDHPVAFEAEVPVVPPGLRAGDRTTTSTRYRSERASRTLFWTQRLRATGWERITVPAGTFDALRVERTIQFEHPDEFRLSPDRSEVLWVSPRVGRWVAREWTGTFMPGSPSGRAGRAREEWVRWELTGWQVASLPA